MQALILFATEKSVEALKRGLKILVVGGMDTNFPLEIRQDERLEFWDSTDPDSSRPKAVPQRVGLALLTQFVGHSTSQRIARSVRAIGPIPNGQITKVLQDAFSELADDEQPVGQAATEVVVRADYSALPEFLIDQLGNEDLVLEVLENETALAKLQTAASERWPGISAQRVRRTLRHALYQIGLFEPVASTPIEGSAEMSDKPTESPNEQIEALTAAVSSLQQEVNRLQKERRGLESCRRKSTDRVEKLEAQLKEANADLRMLLNLFVNAADWIKENCGLQVQVSEKAQKSLIRITSKLGA